MKRQIVIGLLFFAAVLAACSPYPRESERMAEAMRQAEAVYGDGSLLIETDTALFVPGLAEIERLGAFWGIFAAGLAEKERLGAF